MADHGSTPDEQTTPVSEVLPPLEAMPASVGRYVVIGELGRGGMGRVLRGYDPKLQREVALKTLRPGDVSSEARARMVREARAMAKLSHPNVVAVYDVELEGDGGVVLAMELVSGGTLRDWMKQGRPWRQILACFVGAGRGLAAAHAVDLLHRDFKPSNVLVSDEASQLRVKVTDFGLAKPVSAAQSSDEGDGALGSDPELTSAGSVMGTPRYMAPEQHYGQELDARSDQYAFCIALWEALTGQPPFSGNARALASGKSAGPPAWPKDSPVPRVIVDAVRRGLAPDRADRWPAMDALIGELERDPWRRRRMVGSAFVACTIVLGSAAGAWSLHSRSLQRCTGGEAALADAWDDARRDAIEHAILATSLSYAPATWARVDETLARFAHEWVTQHTDACEATAVRGEQSEELLDLRMSCLHRAKQELQATTEVLAAADASVVEKAQDIVDGLPRLDRCADTALLTAEVAPPESPDAVEEVARLRGELARAGTYERAGKFDRAAEIAEGVQADADALGYEPLRTEAMLTLASAREDQSRFPESEALYREGLQSALEQRQWIQAQRAAHNLVYVVGYAQERREEAMAYVQTARGLLASHGPPGSRARALAEARLSATLASLDERGGKLVEAEARQREVLALFEEHVGADHPEAARARDNMANALASLGRNEEAEAEHRKALALRQARLGADHPSTAMSRLHLCVALFSSGRLDAAETECVEGHRILARALGPRHAKVAFARGNLAFLRELQGRYAEAEAEQRAVLEIKIAAFGEDHPRVAATRSGLANALYLQGKNAEAETEARRALDVMVAALGDEHPDVAKVRGNYALVLQAQGRLAESVPHLRLVKSALEASLGDEHPDVAAIWHSLGNVLDRLPGDRDRAEAIALLERAWALRQRIEVPAVHKAEAALSLAQAIYPDDPARARELGRTSIALYREAGPGQGDDLKRAEAWLAAHEK